MQRRRERARGDAPQSNVRWSGVRPQNSVVGTQRNCVHWAEAAHIEFLGIMITCIAIDLAPKFSSCYRYLLQTLPDAMWASPPAASASTWSPARLLGTESVRVRGPSGLACMMQRNTATVESSGETAHRYTAAASCRSPIASRCSAATCTLPASSCT